MSAGVPELLRLAFLVITRFSYTATLTYFPCAPPPSPGTVILGRDTAELEELAARYGQPRFRAKQLLEGVLQGARSVEDITTVRGSEGGRRREAGASRREAAGGQAYRKWRGRGGEGKRVRRMAQVFDERWSRHVGQTLTCSTRRPKLPSAPPRARDLPLALSLPSTLLTFTTLPVLLHILHILHFLHILLLPRRDGPLTTAT